MLLLLLIEHLMMNVAIGSWLKLYLENWPLGRYSFLFIVGSSFEVFISKVTSRLLVVFSKESATSLIFNLEELAIIALHQP